MNDTVDDLLQKIHKKHLSSVELVEPKSVDKLKQLVRRALQFLFQHKKTVFTVLAVLTIGLVSLVFLLEDFLTKRQAYPIRHVLYQCNETVSFSHGRPMGQSRLWDRDARTIIQKGNGDGTKLGDILGIQKQETTDEGGQYQLENKDKTRIAYAVTKLEPVQAGMSFQGTLDFRETYAEILGNKERFINYKIIPERGEENLDINVLADASGQKKLVNVLTTYRSVPLGVLHGVRYRAGTALDEFLLTSDNQLKEKKFFELVEQYQGSSDLKIEQRQSLVEEMAATIRSMAKQSIYISHEDGVIDYLAQESSTYLFGQPGFRERLLAPLAFADDASASWKNIDTTQPYSISNKNGDTVHIRVERGLDIWPGNILLLNKLTIGEAPNVVRPFAHTNNAGYEVIDGHGVIAKIEIEDFFLHYGNDLLYKYYLDKDGNGIIDKTKEHIGQVLYRTHNDDKSIKAEGNNTPNSREAVTQRYSYSFMAGTNWENRIEDFYLCNTIESFIVNEVNRGFGTFSDLGWINNQRSNIRLLEKRSMDNLARAMSAESALVAKQDIVALLRGAKRNYIIKNIKQM